LPGEVSEDPELPGDWLAEGLGLFEEDSDEQPGQQARRPRNMSRRESAFFINRFFFPLKIYIWYYFFSFSVLYAMLCRISKGTAGSRAAEGGLSRRHIPPSVI